MIEIDADDSTVWLAVPQEIYSCAFCDKKECGLLRTVSATAHSLTERARLGAEAFKAYFDPPTAWERKWLESKWHWACPSCAGAMQTMKRAIAGSLIGNLLEALKGRLGFAKKKEAVDELYAARNYVNKYWQKRANKEPL